MYSEIMEVMPSESDMVRSGADSMSASMSNTYIQTFANCARLNKVQACFLEASRMFRTFIPSSIGVGTADGGDAAAGFILIRDTAEDVILRDVGPNRDEQVALPAGTRLVVDMIGMRTCFYLAHISHV